MTAAGHSSREQVRLWLAAFFVSAVLNALVILAFGLEVLANIEFISRSRRAEELAQALQAPESVAVIVPEIVAAPGPVQQIAAPEPEPEPAEQPSFARTTPDQEAERPENPAFIGERNTRATSDLPPEANAEANMPSQDGKESEEEGRYETTVSRLQDGNLAHDNIARPPSPEDWLDMATGPDSPEPMRTEAAQAVPPAPPPVPPKKEFVEGPFPVEREVKVAEPQDPAKVVDPARPPREEPEPVAEADKDAPQTADEKRTMADKDRPGQDRPPTRPLPTKVPEEPGFRGYQYKHRIHGAISSQGRSALDVEDSVLGRYHALLSRAVEQEWQRNCNRNRDYITPGQILVRFVLESSGKVRSVNFVDVFGVGNIQKGFTSESIRSARIPPFPAELKKQLGNEPLEVTYSFTFH
jgi:outer membrane biosynthesis protein TonB